MKTRDEKVLVLDIDGTLTRGGEEKEKGIYDI